MPKHTFFDVWGDICCCLEIPSERVLIGLAHIPLLIHNPHLSSEHSNLWIQNYFSGFPSLLTGAMLQRLCCVWCGKQNEWTVTFILWWKHQNHITVGLKHSTPSVTLFELRPESLNSVIVLTSSPLSVSRCAILLQTYCWHLLQMTLSSEEVKCLLHLICFSK